MSIVFKLNKLTDNDKGITFGGENNSEHHKNPIGEDLVLLFSINSNKVNSYINEEIFPSDTFISVFSTYNKDRYFLDDIVYFGDDIELNHIKTGYTKVIVKKLSECFDDEKISNPVNVDIEKYELDSNLFPAFSFISKDIPNGLIGVEGLLDEYYFIGQFYSAEIPIKNGEVLGLSDANGYLFLRKKLQHEEHDGIFFVQTA